MRFPLRFPCTFFLEMRQQKILCLNSIRLEKQLLLESLLVLLKTAIMQFSIVSCNLDINAYDLHAMVMTAVEVFSEHMASGLAQFNALSAW